MRIINKIINKIKYIYQLIVLTPQYKMIVLLQFVSSMASLIGLPLLVPVLNYMNDKVSPLNKEGNLQLIENILVYFGLEPNFYTILIIAVIFILMGQCLLFISSLLAANAQVILCQLYREDIFKAYSKAEWLWLINSRSGEMNYSVLREAELASVAHLNAQRVFIYTIQVLTLIFIAIRLSAAITLLALFVYGILVIFGTLNSSYVLRLSEDYNEKFKKLANDLSGMQQNKKFFKTSLLNEKLIKGIFTHLRDITRVTIRQNVRIQMQFTLSLIITSLFLISLMFFYKQLSLSYSVLLLILLIFLRISPEFATLSSAYANLDSNIPMHKSLHNRLNELHSRIEENGTEKFNFYNLIHFKNVSFSYPDGSKVFDGLNAVIEPYKTTAFIGSSGVGKSTFLDLFLGLLKPTAGTIYYGDIAYDKLDKSSLRNKIAYVAQETTLVDGTMRENLTIGTPNQSEENIKNIVNKVGMAELVNSMSEGLQTQIGENGVKLSGGQRQRVALARALFMEPQILILDEATSSLDTESEQLIQQTIKSLQKDFTIIIVTHKLSAVRCADKIYVLDKGKVCESGSYNELLQQKGKLYFFDSLQR